MPLKNTPSHHTATSDSTTTHDRRMATRRASSPLHHQRDDFMLEDDEEVIEDLHHHDVPSSPSKHKQPHAKLVGNNVLSRSLHLHRHPPTSLPLAGRSNHSAHSVESSVSSAWSIAEGENSNKPPNPTTTGRHKRLGTSWVTILLMGVITTLWIHNVTTSRNLEAAESHQSKQQMGGGVSLPLEFSTSSFRYSSSKTMQKKRTRPTTKPGATFDCPRVPMASNIFIPFQNTTTLSPCDSADALSQFLQSSDSSKRYYSRLDPLCPNGAQHKIHVAIPYANLDLKTLSEGIQSILNQEYTPSRLTLWLYNDGGNADDPTNDCLCRHVADHVIAWNPPIQANSTTEEENRKRAQEAIAALPTEEEDVDHSRIVCIHSSPHLGPGGGKYWLLRLISAAAGPNDVVVIVDGDDLLGPRRDALQVINQVYLQQGAWFTWGSMTGKYSEQSQPLPREVLKKKRPFRPRSDTWRYAHPRTFKVHLLDHITIDDFTFSDQTWLTKATDRGLIFRLLELSGVDRAKFIPEKIYDYRMSNQTSTLVTVSYESAQAQKAHTARGMIPSPPLELPIHVVIQVWRRLPMLNYQLLWLQDQIGLQDRMIEVTVVNNNWEERHSVEQIVQAFWESHDPVKLGPQSALLDAGSIQSIRLLHSDPSMPLHNFARFLHVEKLMKEIPMDHVIFLDDDQYIPNGYIAALIDHQRPAAMTTWYGKVFYGTPKGQLADYWKSDINMTTIQSGHMWPQMSTFKYGGAGGAIYDANLWWSPQLMRCAQDLRSWSKIDDLWASYVQDALLGWEIRRLPPPQHPLDLCVYEKGRAKQFNKHLIDPRHYEAYQQIKVELNHTILAAATFRDPNVNKTDMFVRLQQDFHWDAVSLLPASGLDDMEPFSRWKHWTERVKDDEFLAEDVQASRRVEDFADRLLKDWASFEKQFSFTSYGFQDVPFILKSEKPAEMFDVSLLTHASAESLPALQTQLTKWNGTASVTVYVTSKADAQNLANQVMRNPEVWRSVHMHLVLAPPTTKAAYPRNHLLNVALAHCGTDFFLAVDTPILPQPNMHDKLFDMFQDHRELRGKLKRLKRLYVLPTLVRRSNGTNEVELPTTKEEAHAGLQGNAWVLQDPTGTMEKVGWNASVTDSSSQQEHIASIAYDELGFAPYLLGAVKDTIIFPTIFRDTYYDHMAWVMELHFAGYTMNMLTDHFLVAAGDSSSSLSSKQVVDREQWMDWAEGLRLAYQLHSETAKVVRYFPSWWENKMHLTPGSTFQ